MTQTVPDISPLMPMHQDPLLVIYNGWQPGVDGLRLKLVINRWTIDVKPFNSRTPIWPVVLYTPTAWLTVVPMIIQLISTRCKQSHSSRCGLNSQPRYPVWHNEGLECSYTHHQPISDPHGRRLEKEALSTPTGHPTSCGALAFSLLLARTKC